jgi:hypothetical protein
MIEFWLGDRQGRLRTPGELDAIAKNELALDAEVWCCR